MQVGDAALGGRVGVGHGHELTRDKTLVAGVVQGVEDRPEIQMPRTGIPAVRIGHVKVKDAVARGADAVLDDRLLDIHVIGVQQQAHVVSADSRR